MQNPLADDSSHVATPKAMMPGNCRVYTPGFLTSGPVFYHLKLLCVFFFFKKNLIIGSGEMAQCLPELGSPVSVKMVGEAEMGSPEQTGNLD